MTMTNVEGFNGTEGETQEIVINSTRVGELPVEITMVSREWQDEFARVFSSQLEPGDPLPTGHSEAVDTDEPVNVNKQIEGDRAIVQFNDNPNKGVSMGRWEGEARARIVVGGRPVMDNTDSRFVEELVAVEHDGVGRILESVSDRYSHWQDLNEAVRIATERDFSDAFRAAKIRAHIGTFTPAEADMLFTMYNARYSAEFPGHKM
jgi:hypothetical protein